MTSSRLCPIRRRGFALVLVVVLLSLLVILLVGLAALARLETHTEENRRDLATARRHALLGLGQALGALQRAAGPDVAATATAALPGNAEPNRTRWTGVWRQGESDPVWLVSSPDGLAPNPTAAAWLDPVTLVGPASADVGATPDADPDAVRVETVPIAVPGSLWPGWTDPADPVIGRFAYWVGDEGVKVSTIVPDERRALTGLDGSPVWPQPEAGLLWGGVDLSTVARVDALEKIEAYSQLGYVDTAFSPARLRQNFHRATTTAYAVVADAAQGGLKTPVTPAGDHPYAPGGVAGHDRRFLVTTPDPEATEPQALPAARFGVRRPLGAMPTVAEVSGAAAAAHLLVAGAFNLNAVDPDGAGQRLVWRSLVGAARRLTWADGTVRVLTDGELDALATELIAARFQAAYAGTDKAQGAPFRRLTDFAAASLLDDVLAATPINVGRTPASPDYVTADQLLSRLLPLLTVRSDTFRLRAYGDTRNPVTGAVLGRAWCEAWVQRVPDYLDPADDPASAPSRPDNVAGGRRFLVTSFRWLTTADI